jgi:GT2 family glycosyltransferase
MSRQVFILLPVHNRKEVTKTFLASLLKQEHPYYQLVLIDDGSTDGTAEMVKAMVPGVTVITGKGNWWWGGSLHQGYKWIKNNIHAPDDVILIANDDIEFAGDYFTNAIQYLHTHPDTLLLSQAYSRHTGQLLDKGIRVNWRKMTFEPAQQVAQINCLSTRGLFMNVSTFLEIGGFHPVLLPHYISDYEFTIRAGRKGFKLTTAENIRIVMDEATTGIRTIPEGPAWNYVKKMFSKKTAGNPLYLTSFILLACPAQFIPVNVLRVWKGFFGQLLKNVKQK